MFKIFALLFIALGIYIGMNYGDEVQNVMDSDAFEKVQETIVGGKDLVVDKIEDAVQ